MYSLASFSPFQLWLLGVEVAPSRLIWSVWFLNQRDYLRVFLRLSRDSSSGAQSFLRLVSLEISIGCVRTPPGPSAELDVQMSLAGTLRFENQSSVTLDYLGRSLPISFSSLLRSHQTLGCRRCLKSSVGSHCGGSLLPSSRTSWKACFFFSWETGPSHRFQQKPWSCFCF